MALGSTGDGSARLRMVWDCTELRGVSEDDPGRVKPKNFDGEPSRIHCWTIYTITIEYAVLVIKNDKIWKAGTLKALS